MTKKELLKAGFKATKDPQFKFEYDLSHPDFEYEPECNPALLFDTITNEFCVTDGGSVFIYLRASTPEEAIKWASQISRFEPNY